jgi:hypothetical protein
VDGRTAVGTCDVLLMTFDTLRYDVAQEALRDGLTPNLGAILPPSGWELRHSPGSFTWSAHQIDDEDQRRRWVVQSLLQKEGLDRAAYQSRFAGDVLEDFAILHEFAGNGLLALDAQRIAPTDAGLEWSDALGPALYSSRTNQLMEAYELR